MLLGSIKTFLVEIKGWKSVYLRSQWRSNDVRLKCNVPGGYQMLLGSTVTFLVETKCCKVI